MYILRYLYIYARDTCRHLCLTERAYIVNKLSSRVPTPIEYIIYLYYVIIYCVKSSSCTVATFFENVSYRSRAGAGGRGRDTIAYDIPPVHVCIVPGCRSSPGEALSVIVVSDDVQHQQHYYNISIRRKSKVLDFLPVRRATRRSRLISTIIHCSYGTSRLFCEACSNTPEYNI